MPVELRNAQRHIRVDTQRLKKNAAKLLKTLDVSENILSILLTDDRNIARIHEQWMRNSAPTDVLSFPTAQRVFRQQGVRRRTVRPAPARRDSLAHPAALVRQSSLADTMPAQPTERALAIPLLSESLGDIVISVETAARCAKGNVTAEIQRYLIHGFLHLIGYDHIREKDHRRMQREATRLQRLLTDA